MEKIIYTIPIYRYSREKFEEKILQKKEYQKARYKKLFSTYSDSDFDKYFYQYHANKVHYENCKLGQLYIIYNSGDIEFTIEMSMRKLTSRKDPNSYSLIPATASPFYRIKQPRTNLPVCGIHDNVSNLTNAEIIEVIKNDIAIISTSELYRKLYFDLEQFEYLAPYVDWNNLLLNTEI